MTGIVLEPDGPSSPTVSGIANRCLRRKSLRTYELLDPTEPAGGVGVCYDVGQLKEIVLMDRRLREEGVVTSVPAGYLEFATRFNQYAAGPERFATYEVINGKYGIHENGRPIVWEYFLVDNSLLSWSHVQQPVVPPPQHDSVPAFGFMDSSSNPQLHSLSTHMHGAVKTTDQLTKFWIKRGDIEQQYASRLADLAETTIGEDELPEMRHAIDGLRMETAKQAMNRFELAKQIAVELESRCVELKLKQSQHWRETYEPTARKLHIAHIREKRRRSGVATEWKQEYKKLRYSLDVRRLETMKTINPSVDSTPSSEWTASSFSAAPTVTGEASREWEELRESCAELERNRSNFVKDMLSVFSDTLLAICTSDNESFAIMTKSNDLFRPDNFIEEFDQKFGAVERQRAIADVPPSRTSGVHASSSCIQKIRGLPPIPPKTVEEGTFPFRGSSTTRRSLPPCPPATTSALPASGAKTIRNPLANLPLLSLSNSPRRPLAPSNGATTSQTQKRNRPTLYKISTTFE